MCYEGWYLEINTHCVLHHAWVNLVSQVKWKMFLFHLVNLRFLLLKKHTPTNQPTTPPPTHTHARHPPHPNNNQPSPKQTNKNKTTTKLRCFKTFFTPLKHSVNILKDNVSHWTKSFKWSVKVIIHSHIVYTVCHYPSHAQYVNCPASITCTICQLSCIHHMYNMSTVLYPSHVQYATIHHVHNTVTVE